MFAGGGEQVVWRSAAAGHDHCYSRQDNHDHYGRDHPHAGRSATLIDKIGLQSDRFGVVGPCQPLGPRKAGGGVSNGRVRLDNVGECLSARPFVGAVAAADHTFDARAIHHPNSIPDERNANKSPRLCPINGARPPFN